MNYRWEPDSRFVDDLDLMVQVTEDDWHMIAFIRWHPEYKHYKCMFLDMEDNEFPDGQTFKTKRGAMRFCERHLPVMWIKHNTREADE
jgi:hypothetical protein